MRIGRNEVVKLACVLSSSGAFDDVMIRTLDLGTAALEYVPHSHFLKGMGVGLLLKP